MIRDARGSNKSTGQLGWIPGQFKNKIYSKGLEAVSGTVGDYTMGAAHSISCSLDFS